MTDDVTAFWNAVRKKWPRPVPDLSRIDIEDQLMLIQAINIILHTLQKNEGKK